MGSAPSININMPLPKRIYINDSYYFLVINTKDRIPVFTSGTCCKIFMNTLEWHRKNFNFLLHAYAILPCHILLLILPERGRDIPQIIGCIKNYARREILKFIDSGKPSNYYVPCGKKCFCQLHNTIKTMGQSPLPTREGNITQSIELQSLLIGKTIWQPRFYDHIIRNEKDLLEKFNYINNNPEKHGLPDPENYPYSSFRNYYCDDEAVIKIDELMFS